MDYKSNAASRFKLDVSNLGMDPKQRGKQGQPSTRELSSSRGPKSSRDLPNSYQDQNSSRDQPSSRKYQSTNESGVSSLKGPAGKPGLQPASADDSLGPKGGPGKPYDAMIGSFLRNQKDHHNRLEDLIN